MTRVVEIRTPGRLHFGLSSFGGHGRQFSGLGMMVEGVGIVLRATEADTFSAVGPHSKRVEDFSKRWAEHCQSLALPASRLEVISAPPDHVGLGIGTQLGLSVVAGLSALFGVEYRDANKLAAMSGRGRRSSIGTYGFLHGGLLVDGGKLPDEPLGQMCDRVEVPAGWRFVLMRPRNMQGLAGPTEAKAISSLPQVPENVTASLRELAHNEILPSARTVDFARFADAVYRYGYLAGQCFATAQGGPFASSSIAELVELLRELGYAGVGQSSWGPTVFAITENQSAADELVAKLQSQAEYADYHYTIAHANNGGAIVEVAILGQ